MSEETTKGLVKATLSAIGYPKEQDTKEDGIIFYKEQSYIDFSAKD